MSRYSKIDRRVWNDGKFRGLSAPVPCGQFLWLFLLSNPHLSSVPGLFTAGEAMLAEAIGWDMEGFRKAFGELFQKGMVKADWKARVVWIPNAIRYNPPESPNVVRGWASALDELPECELKDEGIRGLRAFVQGMGEGFKKAFREAFAKGLPNQEQEQEQEQDSPIPPQAGAREPSDIQARTRTDLPWTVTEMLTALDEGSEGQIVTAPFDRRQERQLAKVIRALADANCTLDDVRDAAAFVAEGGVDHMDGFGLPWLCKPGNLASLIGRAHAEASPPATASRYRTGELERLRAMMGGAQ